jgi:hypothetical protein
MKLVQLRTPKELSGEQVLAVKDLRPVGRNPTPPSDSTELVEVLRRGQFTDFARRNS